MGAHPGSCNRSAGVSYLYLNYSRGVQNSWKADAKWPVMLQR